MHPLREWRTAQGLTLRQVPDLTGVEPTMISRVERGLGQPTWATKIHGALWGCQGNAPPGGVPERT